MCKKHVLNPLSVILILFFSISQIAKTQTPDENGTYIAIMPLEDSLAFDKAAYSGSFFGMKGLYRQPAKANKLIKMENKDASFGDWYFGALTVIFNARDGDTWTASGTFPNGRLQWNIVQYHEALGDSLKCFVSPIQGRR